MTRTSEYNDPDVYYNYKGYKNYNLENNRLVKDDTTEEVSTSSDEDSMNDLHDELTSDDYKNYNFYSFAILVTYYNSNQKSYYKLFKV